LLFFGFYNISVPNDSRCISFLCWSGFGTPLLGRSRTQNSIKGTSNTRYQNCPLRPGPILKEVNKISKKVNDLHSAGSPESTKTSERITSPQPVRGGRRGTPLP